MNRIPKTTDKYMLTALTARRKAIEAVAEFRRKKMREELVKNRRRQPKKSFAGF